MIVRTIFHEPFDVPTKIAEKMQWMYGAAISYATKKLQGPVGGSLLRSRY